MTHTPPFTRSARARAISGLPAPVAPDPEVLGPVPRLSSCLWERREPPSTVIDGESGAVVDVPHSYGVVHHGPLPGQLRDPDVVRIEYQGEAGLRHALRVHGRWPSRIQPIGSSDGFGPYGWSVYLTYGHRLEVCVEDVPYDVARELMGQPAMIYCDMLR